MKNFFKSKEKDDGGVSLTARTMAALGLVDLLGGILTNSPPLTMAGVGEVLNGGIYFSRTRGLVERISRGNKSVEQTCRGMSAAALAAVGLGFGLYNVMTSLAEDNPHGDPRAFALAGGVLALHGVLVARMHKHRKRPDVVDSWKHLTRADILGAVAVAATTGLAAMGGDFVNGTVHPEALGAAIGGMAALGTGLKTMFDVWRENRRVGMEGAS